MSRVSSLSGSSCNNKSVGKISMTLPFAVAIASWVFLFLFFSPECYSSNNENKIDDQPEEVKSVNLDPFPLPACQPNTTSAVYIAYGYGNSTREYRGLLQSITALRKSYFPGQIRVLCDESTATFANKSLPPHHYALADKWHSILLPDLKGKELIPHSNKIRAIQAAAFQFGHSDYECTVFFDTDTWANPATPWSELLSILQLNDVGVGKDCSVRIANVPDFLTEWMPNTGVLAMRNTPRTRLVLRDWLHEYRPCNATHASTCMPGTDQYPFLQLLVKHAARFFPLEHKWNCRAPRMGVATAHPTYAMTTLSNVSRPGKSGKEVATCGGVRVCYIIHDHALKFPRLAI